MKRVASLMIVGLLFLLVACGGAANAPTEPAAADTAAEAAAPTVEPTEAPVEPTAEPTVEPAAVPTATAEPSPTPTAEPTVEPTKEPPPEVSLATLVGLFTQYDDQAGGNNWLLFNEDGTFVGRHGPSFDTGVAVAEGAFTLEGNVLTLVIPESCPDGERYELRFATTTQLHWENLDTTCNYFVEDVKRLPNWKRAEP